MRALFSFNATFLRFILRGCENDCWRMRRRSDIPPNTVFDPRLTEPFLQTTDPHALLILFEILLQYGRQHSSFLRSHKKWSPLLPILMDYVLLDFDPDVEDLATSSWTKNLPAPIEANLRILSVQILYEVCRVQKFSLSDLRTCCKRAAYADRF